MRSMPRSWLGELGDVPLAALIHERSGHRRLRGQRRERPDARRVDVRSRSRCVLAGHGGDRHRDRRRSDPGRPAGPRPLQQRGGDRTPGGEPHRPALPLRGRRVPGHVRGGRHDAQSGPGSDSPAYPDSAVLARAGGDPRRISAELLFEAAAGGDPLARAVVDEACEALAVGHRGARESAESGGHRDHRRRGQRHWRRSGTTSCAGRGAGRCAAALDATRGARGAGRQARHGARAARHSSSTRWPVARTFPLTISPGGDGEIKDEEPRHVRSSAGRAHLLPGDGQRRARPVPAAARARWSPTAGCGSTRSRTCRATSA